MSTLQWLCLIMLALSLIAWRIGPREQKERRKDSWYRREYRREYRRGYRDWDRRDRH